MEKEQKEIDIKNLIRIVYNKIAIWNNEDFDKEKKSAALKVVSSEIIETVINEVLNQFDDIRTGAKILGKKKWKLYAESSFIFSANSSTVR